MNDCPLCHTPPAGKMVPFGFFEAHAGCAEQWTHDNEWVEKDRQDELERQEG